MIHSTSQPSSSRGPDSNVTPQHNRYPHPHPHPPSHRQYPPHFQPPPSMLFGNASYPQNGPNPLMYQQGYPPGGSPPLAPAYYPNFPQSRHDITYHPSANIPPYVLQGGQNVPLHFGTSHPTPHTPPRTNAHVSSQGSTPERASPSRRDGNASLPPYATSPPMYYYSPSGRSLPLPAVVPGAGIPAPLLPPISPFPLQTTLTSPPPSSVLASPTPSTVSESQRSQRPKSPPLPPRRARTPTLTNQNRSPSLSYIISLTRPADPSTAYGLIVSPKAKPPPDVVSRAKLVFHDEDATAPVTKPKAAPAADATQPVHDEKNRDSDKTPIITVAQSETTVEPTSNAAASSTGSATASTPATHTPSPSSPMSTTTSLSAVAASAASTPATSTMSSPTTTNSSAVKPTAPAKPVAKSWADLVKGKAGAAKTASGDAEADGSKAPIIASAVVGVSIPAQDTPHPPSPPASPKSPSRLLHPPEQTNLHSVPLHVLLTAPPNHLPRAPLTQPRGLVNTGNICFANVVLQALLYSGPFYTLFQEIGMRLPADLGRNGLLDATVLFFREFDLVPGGAGPKPSKKPTSGTATPQHPERIWEQEAFIPEFLYDSMKENKRFDLMRRGHQEDAEEFLGFFLDTLHEELLSILSRLQANPPPSSAAWAASSGASAINAEDQEREVQRPLSPSGGGLEGEGWLEVGKKNKITMTRITKARESVITRMFGGKLRSVLRAPGAKDSVTLEPYQPLQLDIQSDKVRTIEDALLHLTDPETVQVHSPSRGGVVDATKQVFIETLPPVLVLHMKRFLYDAVGGVQKSNKAISYKTILEIPTDVISVAQRTVKPIRYKLYGVVNHHGKFATGGHYTIDVLRQDHSEWIRIDDTNIETISESDVLVPNNSADKLAYLLFYQRM